MSSCTFSTYSAFLLALFTGVLLVTAAEFRISKVPVSAAQPPGRYEAAAAAIPNTHKVVLFGGRNSDVALSDTWYYNVLTNQWRNVSGNGPSPRYGALAVGIDFEGAGGKYLYLIGGRNLTGIPDTSLMWAFKIADMTWRKVSISVRPNVAPEVRQVLGRYNIAGGLSEKNEIYISHGVSSRGAQSDTYKITMTQPLEALITQKMYDSTSTYAAGDPHPMGTRASTVTRANELVMFGGCYGSGLCPNQDAWSFDNSTRQWRFLNRGPSPRIGAAMANSLLSMSLEEGPFVDKDQTVVVWGGLEKGSQLISAERSSVMEVDILNVRNKTWKRVRASGSIPETERRMGANMIPVGHGTSENPFSYFVFGGIAENGSFNVSSLRISFQNGNREVVFISSARSSFMSTLIVHGILMGIAFTVFFPLGVCAAKYLRHASSSPVWFRVHVACQVGGFILMWSGLAAALASGSQSTAKRLHVHVIFGYVLLALVSIQILGVTPVIRPKPNDGSPRVIWSFIHHSSGWTVFILGLINVQLGLLLVVSSPSLWIAYIVLVSVLLVGVALVELRRCLRRDHKASRYEEDGIDMYGLSSRMYQGTQGDSTPSLGKDQAIPQPQIVSHQSSTAV